MAPVYNIASFIYPGADILDFAGPLEILTTSPPSGGAGQFKTTTFAAKNPVKTALGTVTIQPDALIEDVEANLENYDLLLIPGANLQILEEYLASNDYKPIGALIKKFASLPPRKEAGHRVIQSVCTGASLLAAAGILANRTVTSHHMDLERVKQQADLAAGGDSNINVIKKRWVDAGSTDAGVRIVTAGGVTSGLDSSLYILETLAGKESAEWAAEIVEFERRKQDDPWGH